MPVEAFTRVTGPIAALRSSNIDTDVIMPKTFLKGIDRQGLAEGVFHDLRFSSPGKAKPDFVLNRPPWTEARFLVTGENFGCGSSREHAVWGLSQLGIRAIIAPSFAGIFFDNCARNGLLAIEADPEAVEKLSRLAENGEEISIDLQQQEILSSAGTQAFDIEQRRKHMLLGGLDAVEMTLQSAEAIAAFEAHYFAERPWLSLDQRDH